MNNKDFINLLEYINEKFELNYGNGEISLYNDSIDFVIEAPNHLTRLISFDKKDIKEFCGLDDALKCINDEIYKSWYELDVDDEFNELWSREFAEKNNFKPSQFIRMLEEDEYYLEEVSKTIEEYAMNIDNIELFYHLNDFKELNNKEKEIER